MRKIRLDVDRLKVESFPTSADGRTERGTVRGQGSGYGCPTDHSISADAMCICRPAYTVNTCPDSDCATTVDVC